MFRVILRLPVASVVASFVAIAGCNPNLPPSAVCDSTDECESGLECLPVAEHDGATCTEVGKACSTSCDSDADCTALGETFKCFDGCNSDRSCGATEIATEDLPAAAVCETTDACQQGLECLPVTQDDGGGVCSEVGKSCSRTCTDDDECTDLGEDFRCFGCDGSATCGRLG